jgi:hypothetical protein
MENFEYDFDGIKLDIGYYTENADPTVGIFSTQIFIEGICHKGEDIYELLSQDKIDFLASELYEALYA